MTRPPGPARTPNRAAAAQAGPGTIHDAIAESAPEPAPPAVAVAGGAADPLPRPDWRESVTLAADLALLGVALTIACATVVAAGGALVAASVAMDRVVRHRSFPTPGELAGTFLRALLPGGAAVLIALAGATLLVLDRAALASGRVPGGPILLVLTALLAAAGLAAAATALVLLGRAGGRGYRSALRRATLVVTRRPLVAVVVLATLAAPAALGALMPATAVLLPGFTLFALHTVLRRGHV